MPADFHPLSPSDAPPSDAPPSDTTEPDVAEPDDAMGPDASELWQVIQDVLGMPAAPPLPTVWYTP